MVSKTETTIPINYQNNPKEILLNGFVESQVLKAKEGDNRLLLLGNGNIIFSAIKLTTEEINKDYLNKILSYIPFGIKIVGIFLVYNENVYEDFDTVRGNLIKNIVELVSKETKYKEFFQLDQFYYSKIIDVLYLSKLELDDLSLINSDNQKTCDASFKIVDCNELLKKFYGLAYTSIYIDKKRILNIMNDENSLESSVRPYYASIKENDYFVNFGKDILIDYKDFTKNNDKTVIDQIIYKSIISGVEELSMSENKEIPFVQNKMYQKMNQIKLNPGIISLLNMFEIEEAFEISYKTKENEFVSLNLGSMGCFDEEEDPIIIKDCFIWNISEKSTFSYGFERSINRILDNLEKSIKSLVTSIEFNHNIFLSFNQIIYPLPLLYNNTNLDCLNSEFLITKSNYYKNQKKPIFPNNYKTIFSTNKLFNVHSKIKTEFSETSKTSYVKGIYEFFHYNQDNFSDEGWGCAYRSLQCLYSWFLHNNILNPNDYPNVPSITDIQKTLVKIGDKPSKLIGSKDWIGAFEVNLVLNDCFGIESQIMHLTSGSEIKSKARELAFHFENVGTPIMIGGGVYAYTILGINYDYTTGDCKFLILDPHYNNKDEYDVVIAKGGISWKSEKLFDKGSFYNLCLPQLPN